MARRRALGRRVVLAAGRPITPARLAVLDERPAAPRSTMCLAAARREKEGPVQVDGHHAPPLLRGHLVKALATAPRPLTPALAKNASTRPRVFTVSANARSTAASSLTSQRRAIALPPWLLSLRERRRVLLFVGAPDANGGARLGHRLGHAEPDAAIAARDERNLSREIEALVRHGGPFGVSARSAGEHAAGRADLGGIIRWARQENEAIDTHALERGAVLRVGAEPGRGEAGEDAQVEPCRIPARRLVLGAGNPRQLGQARVTGLVLKPSPYFPRWPPCEGRSRR